jgi:LPS export ABC transporter protein LptC/lipopolysaccharide transport protein LptA
MKIMERLNLKQLSKSSVVIFLIAIVVFFEILVMAPQVLEKENQDHVGENIDLSYLEQENKNAVDQKMQGVHLVENSENEKGWELFANEATGSSDGQWVLKNVKVQFFNDNMSNYTVTGDLGEIEAKTKDMIIRGNVMTTSSNGYSFKTDTLRYISKQKIMTSLDKVIMQGPPDNSGSGFYLTGEKFLVDMVKNKMSILDKIAAKKMINNEQFNLTSARADFSNSSQEATFIGNVQMKLGTLFVKAPMALFQYSGAKKMLEKIVMNDQVEFSDTDKKGFCKEIEFNLIENKMTMRGQPKVVQGEDEINGHEIVFIDGGKKVKINQAPKGNKP